AIEGTAQVSGAIIASTLTTIVVFLPIVYLHGSAGELFKDQAWTVAFSLLSSLVVAILVIPMLSAHALNPSPEKSLPRSIHFKGYSRLLDKILDRRWLVIAGAIGLIAIAIILIPVVGSEFVPKTDLSEFSIELKLPEGTALRRTEQTVDNIEHIVREILGKDLETLYSKIGPSSELTGSETSIFKGENTATMKIALTPNHKISVDAYITRLGKALSDVPELEMQFIQEQTALQTTLGTESAPIAIEIRGEDLAVLQDLTDQVKTQLQQMNELFNLTTSFDEGRPEVEVVLDRVKAGIYNIGIETISSQLQDQLMGRNAGQWEYKGELHDLTIKLPEISLKQLEDIVIESGGQKFRLNELANIRVAMAPREILRTNQARIGKVTAYLRTDKPFDQVVREIEKRLSKIDFPPDYQYQITGEEQKRKEAFNNLKFALILSIILVYMVLASQFESLIHPFTILLTIPLAGVGAILIFFILGKSLNMMAYIGIIMLAGIAVNDSIILVDAINQLRRDGVAKREAILEAGQRRIRPIIMTSLTTILALLPLTFGFGEGAALRSPMALAVIGGLTTSTLLTLAVIPCVYWVLDQLGWQK
ncbi:MAG: efflux RND transporter permease subunit, partial [candidate division KSB1 bacterium]|nr:efflux RND transporter permease subunit [candidate division KSB1 bacterium]